jgi:hypothetical protein
MPRILFYFIFSLEYLVDCHTYFDRFVITMEEAGKPVLQIPTKIAVTSY